MESKKINQLATEMSPASSDLTIIGDPITGVSKKVTLEQISSLFASSISFYTNYASFPATGSIDTLYCAKDTNKLYIWSGSAYVETFPSQALLDTYQLRSEKGNANGYASLDGSGKVPSTQLPSYVDDIIEVANYASLPVTGETGKIYITLDNNKIYRWSGSVYVEIASNNAIWGSITGTLSNQTDLQNALNAKVPTTRTLTIDGTAYDLSADRTWNILPTGGADGQILAKASATNYDTEWIDNYTSTVKHYVKLSENMTIGTAAYIDDASGTNMIAAKASYDAESTSAQTMGLIGQTGITNDIVFLITEGLLSGVNTSTATIGDPVYLGLNGALIFGVANKPSAPNNLVYLGVVTRVSSTVGEIFVKVQNGYELQELHNVAISSVANNQGLFYESSTSLWKNKSIATVLGYTPISLTSLSASSPLSYNNTTGAFSISQASGSADGYLSSTDWTTFNNKQDALTNPITGTGVSGRIAYFNGTTTQTSSANLTWDATNNRVGIGLTNPQRSLEIYSATADSHLRLSGAAPSVSMGEAITGAVYQAKFGLVTSNGQFVTGGLAGDFVIISQTGATIWATSGGEKMRLTSGGNLGIGTTSPTFTLQVSGTTRISGQLSLGSTITNGTFTYTLPGATGTLALTSDLSSYLPLSGGTLTGALSGTSASFSSSVTANRFIVNGTNGNSGQIIQQGDLLGTAGTNLLFQSSTGNSIGFLTNGGTTFNMFINTSGNVGIGTTSPQTLLSVETSGTQNTVSPIITSQSSGTTYTGLYSIRDGAGDQRGLIFQVYTANVGLNERMRITSTGNVGIGTTSPTNLLTLVSAASNKGIDFVSYASLSTVVGSINFEQTNDILTIMQKTAYSGGALVLGTNSTERMRITSGGNVGIGTSSPTSAKLQVSGSNSQIIGYFYNNSGSTGNVPGVIIEAGTNSSDYSLDARSSTGTSLLKVLGNGNVGIGTSSPTNKLTLYNTVAYNTVNDQLRLIGNNSGGGSSSTPSYNGGIAFTQDATDFAYIRSIQPNPAASWFSKLSFWTLNGNGGTPIERMYIDNNGYVYMTTYANGSLSISGSQIVSSSDSNLKTNAGFIDSAIDKVMNLKPRYFYWNEDSGIETKEKQLGFYAQEVKEALGEEVANDNGNGKWGIYDRGIIAMLTKAIQEQQAQIEELKAKIK